MKEIYHCLWIDAPLVQVHNAITDKNGLANWWTRDLDHAGTLESVTTFRFTSGSFNKMKMVTLEPHLVEWGCVDGDEEWIGSKISFELSFLNNKTKLGFSHYGFKSAQTEYIGECSYIWAYYLTSLKDYCETGTGTPNQGALR